MMTTILLCLLAAAYFGFWNKVRGGWPKIDPKPWWKKSDYLWLLACFAFAATLTPHDFGTIGDALGFWLAMLTGWGVYIGAIINAPYAPAGTKYFNGGTASWGNEPSEEVGWIDFCIRPFKSSPTAYGFMGCWLRGLMGAALFIIIRESLLGVFTLAAALDWMPPVHFVRYDYWPLIAAFCTMPIWYLLPSLLRRWVPANKQWGWGEAGWGAALGIGYIFARKYL